MLREKTLEAIGSYLKDPRMPGLLLLGFKAWAVTPPERTSGEPLEERLGPAASRAVFDVPEGRIALAVRERGSVEDALQGLADQLEGNQLAELARAPDELGEIGFVHPPQAPPAVFFVRGNLVLTVASFGRAHVDVLPFARRVDAELAERPEEVREGGIDVTEKGRAIRARARWAGPDAYLKFLAPGATLRKEDGEAVVVEGEPRTLEVYVIERGRETRVRRLRG